MCHETAAGHTLSHTVGGGGEKVNLCTQLCLFLDWALMLKKLFNRALIIINVTLREQIYFQMGF